MLIYVALLPVTGTWISGLADDSLRAVSVVKNVIYAVGYTESQDIVTYGPFTQFGGARDILLVRLRWDLAGSGMKDESLILTSQLLLRNLLDTWETLVVKALQDQQVITSSDFM